MLFGFLKRKLKAPIGERRREPRYEAEDEFMLEFKGNQSHYIGASRDVSIHGVRFVTTCKLSARREILLNFRFPQDFPGEKRISVPAKVIRVYKPMGTGRYRVGCSLNHEADKTKETMRQFIVWLQTKEKS